MQYLPTHGLKLSNNETKTVTVGVEMIKKKLFDSGWQVGIIGQKSKLSGRASKSILLETTSNK